MRKMGLEATLGFRRSAVCSRGKRAAIWLWGQAWVEVKFDVGIQVTPLSAGSILC